MKKAFANYKKTFLVSVVGILSISTIVFFINNYSPLAAKQIMNDAKENSKKVSEDLYGIQTEVDAYVRILEKCIVDADSLVENTGLDVFKSQITTVLHHFLENHESADGYFFRINTESMDAENEVFYNKEKNKTSHISTLLDHSFIVDLDQSFVENPKPKWSTAYNAFSNSTYLTYIVPIWKEGQYLGFIGITINMDYLSQIVQNGNGLAEKYKRVLLLTEDKEILVRSVHDVPESLSRFQSEQYSGLFQNEGNEGYIKVRNNGKRWICTYVTLPSGQIFVEEQDRLASMRSLNWFILLITIFSIMNLWIVQKNQVTGKSAFDRIAEFMVAKDEERLSVMDLNRKKAVVALGVGASGVFLSYSVYYFALGVNALYGFLYLFMGIASIVLPYLNIRWNNRLVTYILVYGMGICPFLLHIGAGGFGSGNTGVTLSWVLILILLSQFVFDDKKAKNAIYIFTLILFTNVLVEIYVLKNFDYERLFVFITSLFFVGFALVVATSVYLKGAVRDYNALESLSEEIKDSQVQLVQREKMAALGQLIAGIAHEINTPIGAIKASAQTMETTFVTIAKLMYRCGQEFDDVDYDCMFGILKMSRDGVKEMKSTLEVRNAKQVIGRYFEDVNLPYREEILEKVIRFEITDLDEIKANVTLFRNPDICEILNIIAALSSFTVGIQTILFAIARISKIIFALKSYSHVDERKEEAPFDVIRNVEDVLVLYHNQIKQSIALVRDYDEDVPKVWGKQDEMYQVWTNLIQNAIYAMNEGGTLTISVKNVSNEWVKVDVADTGSGIPKEVKDRIFEPFFTTKPLGEGSGMGLDISRKVVLEHGGKIKVWSEDGKGTVFTVEIPIR